MQLRLEIILALASGLFVSTEVGAQCLWSQGSGSGPAPRYFHALAYDAERNNTVLFGGGNSFGALPQPETWVWDGITWTQKFPANNPSKRYEHGLAYDSNRNVTVFFGGNTGSPAPNMDNNDTWEWDGTNWTQRFPTNSPPVRSYLSLAYDSIRMRTVLFGGWQHPTTPLRDTWEWDGTNWTQASPSTSPPPRYQHALAYDSFRQVTVLFGGHDGGSVFLPDTWEWDGTNWIQKYPANSPGPRRGHALAYDSARRVTVLFGGWAGGNPRLSDTWEWDGTNWTLRCTGGPPPARKGHALAYDSARGKAIMFGGSPSRPPQDVFLGDTWEYSGPPTVQVRVDIKPQSCPNPLNVKSNGVLPVALLGGTIDLAEVDLDSIKLEGVDPLRISPVLVDAAKPFEGNFTGDCSDCTTGFDGEMDLILHFDSRSIVNALGNVSDGDCVVATLTGEFKNGGESFEGKDVVRILKKGKE